MLTIKILTLFPEMFAGPFSESILKRAQEKGLVKINIYNLRKWAKDKRGTVDDRPYGGGVGMVMMATPIVEAIEELKGSSFDPSELRRDKQNSKTKDRVVLLSPRGKVWQQNLAKKYSKLETLILICGHYEGTDERIKNYIDDEISIGDYVLTGGEIPTLVLIDSIIRLIPGVLNKTEATQKESFSSSSLLEYPQYTRPENFRGSKVPKILLSGNHKNIKNWREKESVKLTKKKRPDLVKNL